MRIVYENDSGGAASDQYAVLMGGTIGECTLQDIEFDVILDFSTRTSMVWAVGGSSKGLPTENTTTWGVRVINCMCISDGSGFKIGSQASVEYFNTTVVLTTRQGANAPDGIDHTGIDVVGAGRTFFF